MGAGRFGGFRIVADDRRRDRGEARVTRRSLVTVATRNWTGDKLDCQTLWAVLPR